MIEPNYVIELQDKSLCEAMAQVSDTGEYVETPKQYSIKDLQNFYSSMGLYVHFTHPVI